LGVNPDTVKDVDEWIELYARADYLLKAERLAQYSAVKQAMVEVVTEMFSKDG